MAIQIQLQSTNYNGQLADITFYPCSGGSINLGYQIIPFTYTNDDYEGTYDLFFSAFSQTCQLIISCPTPTPSITPTTTPTPTTSPIPPSPSVTTTPTITPSPTTSPIPPSPSVTSTPTTTPTPTTSPIPPSPSVTSTPTPTPTPSPVGGFFILYETGDVMEAENGDLIEYEH